MGMVTVEPQPAADALSYARSRAVAPGVLMDPGADNEKLPPEGVRDLRYHLDVVKELLELHGRTYVRVSDRRSGRQLLQG